MKEDSHGVEMSANLSKDEILELIRHRVEKYGSVAKAAEYMGIHRISLHKILTGERQVGDKIAERLGLVKTWLVDDSVAYRKGSKLVYR